MAGSGGVESWSYKLMGGEIGGRQILKKGGRWGLGLQKGGRLEVETPATPPYECQTEQHKSLESTQNKWVPQMEQP